MNSVQLDDPESSLNNLLNLDNESIPVKLSDKDKELRKFVLREAYFNNENRLVLPALWNEDLIDCLPNNFSLANSILHSNLKKLRTTPEKLTQYNEVIKQQLADGIIVRVDNLDNLKSDKSSSFLAHHAVFREKAESTKCRIVYMSNLAQKGEGNLSHNQVSHPGPNMNPKLPLALTMLRFNSYLFYI